MTRSLHLPCFVLAVTAVTAAAAPALARPTKVALTRIEGDTSGLGKVVAGALDDSELEIVAGKPVSRAIDRLGLGPALGDRDAAKLAAELDVDAVVQGAFDRRGHKLRFTVFARGKKGKPFSVQVGDADSDRFRTLVRKTMVAKVTSAVPAKPKDKARGRDDADPDAGGARRPVPMKNGIPERDDDIPPGLPVSDAARKDGKSTSSKTAAREAPADEEPAHRKKSARSEDDAEPARAKAERVAARDDGKSASGRAARDAASDDPPARRTRGRDDARGDGKSGPGKVTRDAVADEEPARRAKSGRDDARDVSKAASGKTAARDDAPDGSSAAPAKIAAQDAEPPHRKKVAHQDADPARDGDAAAGKTAEREAADAEQEHGAKRTSDDGEQPVHKVSKRRVAAADTEDDEPGRAMARREPAAREAGHGANLAALRVDLGASMAGRQLAFDSKAFDGAPKPYSNAPVLGGRLEAELYPLAIVDPTSWLAGFGVAVEYDQTVALTLRASDEMTVPLKITERHYSFGGRYRLAFGHQSTSPTLTLGAGYAARTFTVARGGLMSPASIDLPDVDYRMIDPGLSFRLPLGDLLAITVGGRGLIVTAAGPIQRPDQYGTASAIGASASAGLELVIGRRIAVRAVAEATQLQLKFTGNGQLSRSRDGDSSSVDVRGATDRYYGGTATIAVMY